MTSEKDKFEMRRESAMPTGTFQVIAQDERGMSVDGDTATGALLF